MVVVEATAKRVIIFHGGDKVCSMKAEIYIWSIYLASFHDLEQHGRLC